MAKFEKISKYADIDLPLPVRKTMFSAGYDLAVAEDIVIPPISFFISKLQDTLYEKKRITDYFGFLKPLTLEEMSNLTKELNIKLPLVPTGMKCQLGPDEYLELSLRSSFPLKHWLMMGNAIGIVDSDYYNNESNEGHIYFQLINMGPFAIKLQRGDVIGQGIIKKYGTVEFDDAMNTMNIRTGGFGSTN